MHIKTTLKQSAIPALRIAMLALCTGSLGAVTLFAQNAPPPPGYVGGMHGPAEMQKRQLEHMTTYLDLTPAQVTQIKAIQDESQVQMTALRSDTSITNEDKHAKVMALRETQQGKIRAVLTDTQKTKFDAMMDKMNQRREGHKEEHPAPPPSA